MSQSPTIYYAVRRERGDSWNPHLSMRQQEHWEEHANFMDALADEGFVVLGGPLGEEEDVFLLIIATESDEAISDRLADDPWTSQGLLRIAAVERWEILLNASE